MGTGRSYRFRPSINQRWAAIKAQVAQSSADLMLHGGDFTRDGDTHEYEYLQARRDLEDLPFPTFAIPGNMDVGNKHTHVNSAKRDDVSLNMTSKRLRLFAAYYGPLQWTFVHRDVRFTGFYAALAGSGLHEEQMMWDMIERLHTLPPARHHVAVMHYWPYIHDVDEPTWDITDPDQYLPWYFSIDRDPRLRLMDALQKANVTMLFCGHVHTGLPVETVGDMRIYKTPAAGNTAQMLGRFDTVETRNGYYQCDVDGDEITATFIAGTDQSPDEGTFGPWGHPAPHERDYSVATEQPPLLPDPDL